VTSLRDINAVRVKQRSFEVTALDRLLLYWATHRSLKKDIVYQTRADAQVKDIERGMPNEIAFTGYTAYKFLFNEVPADYSEVYVYATDNGLKEVKRRFGANGKIPNVIVRKDAPLGSVYSQDPKGLRVSLDDRAHPADDSMFGQEPENIPISFSA
jgi:hypothetical protein